MSNRSNLVYKSIGGQHRGFGAVHLATIMAFGLLGGNTVGCQRKPGEDAKTAQQDSGSAKIPSHADVDDSMKEHITGERFRVEYGEKDVFHGAAKPLVTIVEFSDFQCPFCKRAADALDKIVKDYPEDVRVVFRHYPLSFHKEAKGASQAVLAAAEQGKGWEMHDALFANQKELKPEKLVDHAKSIGVSDIAAFEKALNGDQTRQQVEADMKYAEKFAVRSTPTLFVNGKVFVGAIPYEQLKKEVDAEIELAKKLIEKGAKREELYAHFLRAGADTRKAEEPKQQAQAGRPDPALSYAVPTDNRPSVGPEDALVTIVEFSDFECPFCGRVNETLTKVKEKYKDDVRVVFRNQPLTFHKNAKMAAQAGLAAHKQGKFWEMHDLMFANAKELGEDKLIEYAQKIGLNVDQFKTDLKSKEIETMVDEDIKVANQFGARGTPAFFINGRFIGGAQPFEQFDKIIEEEKGKAEKALKDKGVAKKDLYAEMLKGWEKEVKVPPPPPPADHKRRDVTVAGLPSKGSAKDAKITILECSDFDCPFCSRATATMDRVVKEYGDKVLLAFSHYPLPFHTNAEPAHRAAQAAHQQGKFWEMHDKLFADQKKRSEDDFLGYAKELGLDVEKFKKDFADPKTAELVKTQTETCQKLDVRGAPGFLINGRLMTGAQPYERFKEVLDEELSGGFEAKKDAAVAQNAKQ